VIAALKTYISGRRISFPPTAADVFVGLFCLWWLLLVIFYAFPEIDLATSRYFFTPSVCPASSPAGDICGTFAAGNSWFLTNLRLVFFRVPYVIAIVQLCMLIACYTQHGSTFNALRARNLKIALGALLIGPGLIVNLILKEHWGRPRPYSVTEFGGMMDFVQAGSLAGKCVSNCSFISGEAASAGWLLCLLFFIPQPARTGLFLPLIAISLLTSVMRLAFGGHFVSDIVLGWLLAVVVFAGLIAFTDSSHHTKNSEI
jgi:lipid A 4'-phosphatase